MTYTMQGRSASSATAQTQSQQRPRRTVTASGLAANLLHPAGHNAAVAQRSTGSANIQRAAARPSVVTRYATSSTPTTLPGVDASLAVRCRIVVPYHPTSHGQQLILVGSCEELGNWDVKKGLKFTWSEGHSHEAEVELPIHNNISCKLVVLGENDSSTWEPEANRELLLAPTSLAGRAAGFTLMAHWGFPECTQMLANSLRRGGSSPGKSSLTGYATNASAAISNNPLLASMKKALAQASSRERVSSVIAGSASWEDDVTGAEEEHALVQCQVTVLVPKNGPKLKPEQSLVLVGGSAALGRWDPANGLPLERMGEDSPMWITQAELPLGEGLQAKVVVVDAVTGKADIWEPCENRTLERYRGTKPVMISAYYGVAPTHSLEVDRLSSAAASSNPQVVQLLRQQLAATSTQLDGLRRERDDMRKSVTDGDSTGLHMELDGKHSGDKAAGRFEMVHLAEQLQTTRKLYETTKKEAKELGGAVGVTRQLCDAAKKELTGLATQLEAAKRAYEALAPEVERMERKLMSTNRAFDATKPELQALEAQLERARGLFDRTLQKIETAKSLTTTEYETVRRRVENQHRVRELQFAKH